LRQQENGAMIGIFLLISGLKNIYNKKVNLIYLL